MIGDKEKEKPTVGKMAFEGRRDLENDLVKIIKKDLDEGRNLENFFKFIEENPTLFEERILDFVKENKKK